MPQELACCTFLKNPVFFFILKKFSHIVEQSPREKKILVDHHPIFVLFQQYIRNLQRTACDGPGMSDDVHRRLFHQECEGHFKQIGGVPISCDNRLFPHINGFFLQNCVLDKQKFRH